jgi:hypothetical protein
VLQQGVRPGAGAREHPRQACVRGEYHEWEIHPTKWNRVREPAVYIQTRRTIEPDHYTLIRTSVCP